MRDGIVETGETAAVRERIRGDVEDADDDQAILVELPRETIGGDRFPLLSPRIKSFKAILANGYDGYLGQEFIPKREPIASMAQAFKICNV